MPIARCGEKLIFFAHVPKCAGSAVEGYLKDRFGDLALLDKRHIFETEPSWTATSPQHLDNAALDRLFPPRFFDHTFAVVRHPVARLVSAFHFQRDVETTIDPSTPLSAWIADLPRVLTEHPYAHDNHLRPMAEMVPADATIFHLEDGLDAIVPWIDDVCGSDDGPRTIRAHKPGKVKAQGEGQPLKPEVPTEDDRAMIAEIYAEDFRRFGYAPTSDLPVRPAAKPKARAARPRPRRLSASALRRLQSHVARLLRA